MEAVKGQRGENKMLKQPHYCGIYGKHQLQQGFLLVLWTALTCQGWNMFFNVPDGWRHTLLSPFKLDSVGSTSRGKEFKQTLNTLFLSLSIRSLSALILPTFLPSECCNPGNQPLWQEIKQDMTLWLEPWPRALRGEDLLWPCLVTNRKPAYGKTGRYTPHLYRIE